MSLRSMSYDVGVLLGALRVPYIITNVLKHITIQYVIEDFGVVISVINPGDYNLVKDRIETTFPGWRQIFISTANEINDKRYEVIWDLMRSGYMKWLRSVYRTQFPAIIETDNLGGRIIEERLRVWGGEHQYKFLIEDNIQAQKVSFRRIITQDPSFFDYMP